MTDIDTTTTGGVGAAIVTFLGAGALALRKWAGQKTDIEGMKAEIREIREEQNAMSGKLNALVTAYGQQTDLLREVVATQKGLSDLMGRGLQELHDIKVTDAAYRGGLEKQLDRIERRQEG